MNPVNGFTPEGLPTLLLGNMPVQSTIPALKVTRPEIYFGELTNTDVYVKTRQKEFNYPQGETNSLTSYEGTGGILLGGFFRRLLIALDRGDLAKLPFSDDVTAESRLLMRRNIRDRVAALAPFLTFDDDPYIVVGDDGRLSWMMDGFTTSESLSVRAALPARTRPHQLHAQQRQGDRRRVRRHDDVLRVRHRRSDHRGVSRRLPDAVPRRARRCPPTCARHVRYPELMLQMQAAVYGLYHMTDPGVFYNREDLWSVAAAAGAVSTDRGQTAQAMEPNFVLMKLPGESATEFVEILPFTPANRNNLIGWIAGRSDGANYGKTIVYDFPKTKLVDGPLQVEARLDQNAQLSGQLSLWNQQGSHVRRGSLVVIPVGRALLYAEPIYLQAERSPMPELRLVVLALQDRLAYGPTFEVAMAALFGNGESTLATAPNAPQPAPSASTPNPAPSPQPRRLPHRQQPIRAR